MAHVTNWKKFKLLLWKNWLLQWNQKWQVLIELLLPPVFALILVFVRSKVMAETKTVTHYRTLYIQNLNMFRILIDNSEPINLTLCYSPINPLLEKIVKEAADFLHLPGIKGYINSKNMQIDLEFRNYITFIQFDDNLFNITKYPKHFSFALRFPSELRTALSHTSMNWMTSKLFLPMEFVGPRNLDCDDGCLPVGYLREGFLSIQHALSMSYIKLLTNNKALPYVDLQRFPYPEYIYDPLMMGLKSTMSLIILLSFMYPCTYIVKHITAEKEKQLKEVMKIMGLNNWIHWTAWFFKSFIMMVISSILMTIILKIRWKNNVAVLTHVQGSVLLFFLLIYAITSICFCFLLTTFFFKASTAAAITGLIWFIAYMPFTFYMETYDDLSLTAKLVWCLISNTALGFAFKLIIEYEGNGGLQWGDLFTSVNTDDNLTVGYIVIMMLLSCVLYLFLCLYVEQIFPGDYGVPKKWNFIINKRFWLKRDNFKDGENMPNGFVVQKNSEAFESEPYGKNVGLQVMHLKKQFGQRMAVKDLSMNIYEDEITVLLGHNGAGKTTTISMLTGLIPPSSGTAIINGCDIRTNIEGARLSLGICPQHNVLFDDLTVREHLTFFSRLKGLEGEDIKREVFKYLRMIQLENKSNVASKNLSGGMKRKLSICCALTGGTKVVLCDEPSSGMDPAARRQLWDLLQSEKKGRTILLTTHYMDEADVLGDRIAIMCDGELKCYGTSFFLKKNFGTGYRLICVKRDDCDSNEVTALLQKYIPDLQPEADIGAELFYQLPDSYSNIFEEMLGSLEEQSENLKLNGYGISITSLEEVFMKIGAENVPNFKHQEDNISNYTDTKEKPTNLLFSENKNLLKGIKLWTNQWHAMFLKKFFYTYRNKLLFLIQNLMPIFIVTTTILISRSQGTFKPLPALTITLNQYPQAVTVLETASELRPISIHYKIAEKYKSLVTSYGTNYELFETGNKKFSDFILALGAEKQVHINANYLVAVTVGVNKITAWFNNQPLHTAPLALNLVHNAMLKAYKGDSYHLTVTNYPLPYTSKSRFAQLTGGSSLGTQLSTNICFCFCFVSAFYILFLIKERESRSKLLQFVSGVRVWIFWFSQIIWDFLTLTITTIIVIITTAYWQENCLSTAEELGRYLLILILFACSVLPFTYLLSFYFTEPATGFARISIINILSGMAMFIVDLVMSLEIFNTKDTANLLDWFFRIFPHFCLAKGLNKLYVNVATKDFCGTAAIASLAEDSRCDLVPKCCKTIPYFAWEDPGILPEIVYLSSTAIIFFLIIIIREYNLPSELIHKIKQKTLKPPLSPEDSNLDEDVEEEKKLIMEMTQSGINSMNLVLDRVTKYYGKFLAVNQISLSVKPGECFGLLGVNGAGKSSTFKIMTGDVRLTFGNAYVKGLNLSSDMNKIYKEIGYCPQFDALLEDLTGRETLKIFCLLRGIPKKRINVLAEEFSKSFGFSKHLDKKCKRFSGGNKRKLSAALAVIGSPSVIYLDEPTTSMDPAARRHLWNIVCGIRDSGKSIVLTSHSMEECEALCTRLAIMVNGEFKCIGSTQHLKNKFSKGLILKIKVKRKEFSVNAKSSLTSNNDEMLQQDINNIKLFIESEIPQAILQEEYQGLLTFYIPFSGLKWSKMFGLIERHRNELNIEDYSISQTTLEEIFLKFAKYQREDVRQIK